MMAESPTYRLPYTAEDHENVIAANIFYSEGSSSQSEGVPIYGVVSGTHDLPLQETVKEPEQTSINYQYSHTEPLPLHPSTLATEVSHPQVQQTASTGTQESAHPVTKTHMGEKRRRGRPRREDASWPAVSTAVAAAASSHLLAGVEPEIKSVVEEVKVQDAVHPQESAPTLHPQEVPPPITEAEPTETTTTTTTEAAATTPIAAAAPKKGTPPSKKMQRDTYYCKHCDTNFPVGFFRNVQQFGAHCSNCSRGRSIQTPDDSYASRLPTRLQRALKRKKRQEEGGGAPRKRGRKSKKERTEARPAPLGGKVLREKRKQKIPRHYLDDSEDSVSLRTKKRERKAVQYNDAYVYDYHVGERRIAPGKAIRRAKDWGDLEQVGRRRGAMFQRMQYMPMSVHRVDELPLRLLLRIFSFLDRAGDLAKCGMTCKLFGRLYNHDSLWKRLFCKQWGESLGYAFAGSWKYRYKARVQYIQSRKRPDFLPSLRLDNPNDNMNRPSGDSSSASEGIFASTAKTTPVPTHGHWVAERIVDSQPKVDPITGKSRMEYLIKWEGFGDDWNSWLNEEDVWCKELIDEYNSAWETNAPENAANAEEDWYAGAKRKAAAMASRGGGKGSLFSSMGALVGGESSSGSVGSGGDTSSGSSQQALWDLDMDIEMDEDLWRDTWDNGSSVRVSDEEDDEEDDYEEVPVTKEEREKQQREFLRSLDANPNYKPVILFFEKS